MNPLMHMKEKRTKPTWQKSLKKDKLHWYKGDNVESVDLQSINGWIVLINNVGFVVIKITLLNNVFTKIAEKYSKKENWRRIIAPSLASNFVDCLIDLIIY